MKNLEKTPYFSQKTSSTYENYKKLENSYFFTSLFCCEKQSYEQITSSTILKNHQNIESLIDSRHYCQRIFPGSKSSFQYNNEDHIESLKNKHVSHEHFTCQSTANSNPKPKPKEDNTFYLKQMGFNEINEPEFCIIQNNGKILLGKINIQTVFLKKTPNSAEKNHRKSFKSSIETGENVFKYSKDENRLNCTISGPIFQNDLSNPSFNSAQGSQIPQNQTIIDFSSKSSKILQRLACHISKKIKKFGNIMIDAYTKTGIPAMEFARNGFQVISMNTTLHYCKILHQNATFFGLKDRIDVIQGEFLDMQNLKGDIVFFNPSFNMSIQDMSFDEEFSIFDNIAPDISLIFEKSFEVSKNLVMVFSNKTDISEIATLFWRYFEKYGKKLENVSIKIELFKINAKLEVFIVYYGEIAEIKTTDERDFFESYLLREYPSDFRDKNFGFKCFLQHISPTTLYRIFNQNLTETNYKDSLYFQFLWICLQENMISKELYETLINYEKCYLEAHQIANKTTFFTEKTNDPISPKNILNNFEIFTFSNSKSHHLTSTKDIKLISSSHGSPQKNSSSPFFKTTSLMKQIQKAEKINDISVSKHSESEDDNFEEPPCPSSYSEFQNSLSPPSYKRNLFNAVENKKSLKFETSCQRSGFRVGFLPNELNETTI